MKNASCQKLLIDRSKSKKVGTLKDISLFGNFTFPIEGEFEGGLILRPLAVAGTTISKTRAQISQLSGRQVPIAGATGAKTSEDQPATEPIHCPTPFSSANRESYAVRFIQHAPEHPSAASLNQLHVDHYLSQRPGMGYALKHGPGKRNIFSQAQKDIMIEFYNRQAVNRIRAEPKDVMRAMEQAGLEVLTANQIKSWWSTYHRKNKSVPASMPAVSIHPASALPSTVPTGSIIPQATVPPASAPPAPVPTASAPPRTVPSGSTICPTSVPPPASVPPTSALPASVPQATVSSGPTVPPGSTLPPTSVPSASVPLASVLPASVPPATVPSGPTVPPGSTIPPASVPTASALSGLTVPPASVPPGLTMPPTTIPGSISQFSSVTVEWSFPECLSQSTIMGRNGSNACAFICLYFGQVASKGVLSPRQGLMLPAQWRDSLEQSIIQGNDLHDELFDHEGVDLDVEGAVEMAGDDCGVVSLGQQKDLIGTSAKDLLAGWLNELSSRRKRSSHLFCASGRTMLLFIDSCGELYFVDSHLHKDSGALIASAPPGNGLSFADWIDKMMHFHWQTPLTIGSVTEIIYMFI